jgi:hypothetical protein
MTGTNIAPTTTRSQNIRPIPVAGFLWVFVGVWLFQFILAIAVWKWPPDSSGVIQPWRTHVSRFVAFPLILPDATPDLEWPQILRPVANAALWAAVIALAFWLASLAGWRWRGRAILTLVSCTLLLFLPYAAGALPLQHSDDSLVGIGGLLVTTLGFVVAIWQILETKRLASEAKDSATAAQQAADRTMSENRAHFLKFEISFVQRLFNLAAKNIEQKQWIAAGDFLGIAADCVAQARDQSTIEPLTLLGRQLRDVGQLGVHVENRAISQHDFHLQHWGPLVTTFWDVTNQITTALPAAGQESHT